MQRYKGNMLPFSGSKNGTKDLFALLHALRSDSRVKCKGDIYFRAALL